MSGGFWCFSCSCWPLSHRRWAFSEKLARMASAKRNIVVLVWDQKKIKDLAWTGVAGTYFCDFLWVNDGEWWPHEGVIADFSSVFSPLSPGWDCLRQGRWPSCWNAALIPAEPKLPKQPWGRALHGCRGGDIPIGGMNIRRWCDASLIARSKPNHNIYDAFQETSDRNYIHWWTKYVYIPDWIKIHQHWTVYI